MEAAHTMVYGHILELIFAQWSPHNKMAHTLCLALVAHTTHCRTLQALDHIHWQHYITDIGALIHQLASLEELVGTDRVERRERKPANFLVLLCHELVAMDVQCVEIQHPQLWWQKCHLIGIQVQFLQSRKFGYGGWHSAELIDGQVEPCQRDSVCDLEVVA